MYQKYRLLAQRMGKTAIVAIAAVILTAGAANAQMQIAVFDFKAGTGVGQGDVDGIAAIFGTYFINPQKFTLVERTQINRVISEQGFQHSADTTADGQSRANSEPS